MRLPRKLHELESDFPPNLVLGLDPRAPDLIRELYNALKYHCSS
jgi:hypothetical protein